MNAMPCIVAYWSMNILSCCLFVGLFVQHSQRTTTNIRPRKDACMMFLNCCIMNCDELHPQSCHEYCIHESEYVARQGTGDVFLYACNNTSMPFHVSWSVVSACGCEFWSLNHMNPFVRHMLLFMVRIGELSYLVRSRFLSDSRRHSLFCDSARIEG